MNKNVIKIIGFSLIFICFQVSGCVHTTRNKTALQFESYAFDADSPLASRVSVPPEFLISYLKDLDGRKDYRAYKPTGTEKKIIEDSLATLPPLFKKILKKKLIGIFFIDNFLGSGLTEWIVDSGNTVYVLMVFNSSVFSKNISTLMTDKENTCFFADDPAYKISIDCGQKYTGFNYILLHESTHAVDYVINITPYVDTRHKKFLRSTGSETDFTRNIWIDYDRAREHFNFTGRTFFYGLGKPQLRTSEAIAVYRDLSRSPFVSLYGSLSWAEDLAEIVSLYHITNVMKQPFVITVSQNNRKVFLMKPMESRKVRERIPYLQYIYNPGE